MEGSSVIALSTFSAPLFNVISFSLHFNFQYSTSAALVYISMAPRPPMLFNFNQTKSITMDNWFLDRSILLETIDFNLCSQENYCSGIVLLSLYFPYVVLINLSHRLSMDKVKDYPVPFK